MKWNDEEFRLTDNFIKSYKRKKVDFGPLGYFTFKRTYARPLPGSSKTEEWWQTIQRVVEGCFLVQKLHCKDYHLPWNDRKSQISAQKMYKSMFDMKFLPPGRGLWAMGTEFMFKNGGACLNNCGFTTTANIDTDFSGPFVWLMDMSMYGVGVGFDTEGAYSSKQVFLKSPRTASDPHIVEDSREGWVDAFRRILDAYSGQDTLPATWDYSEIRPAGEPIKGFGGIAPGYAPLKELVDRTTEYLSEIQTLESPINSTIIVDLMNFAGAAVVAGGIRRTAEIAFGRMDDEEFTHLKDVENLKNNALSRWASNNSHRAEIGDDYKSKADAAAINGEPGFFWLENARAYGRMGDPPNYKDARVMGCNPCGEQSLEDRELCNLVETFPSRHESNEDYSSTLKLAYLYAKTVTLVKTHCPQTNQVMTRNRRIGLSQSGIIENIGKVGFRNHIDWCKTGYTAVQHWDKTYSEWLGIPESVKTTTVKPSGTVSLLPGTTPGIHYPHSEYYLRRVRVSKNSSLWDTMEKAGYPVEDDLKEPDYTKVVSFPVHEPNFVLRKDDISIWEQFELASAMQKHWSDNQVSITVTIREQEKSELVRALEMYEDQLKAISFLPLTDHQYEQAPYEEITQEEFEKLTDNINKVKLNIGVEDEGKSIDKFCDAGSCEI